MMNRQGPLAASYDHFDSFTGEGMQAFLETDHEKAGEAGNDDAGTAIIPLRP